MAKRTSKKPTKKKAKKTPKPWTDFHRDVAIPLSKCDYNKPITGRVYPFRADTPEDTYTHFLAAHIMVAVPYWRQFRLWPDHRATDAAYAELRRLLVEAGYSEKDFEQSEIGGIVDLLYRAKSRSDSKKLKEPDEHVLQGIYERTPLDSTESLMLQLLYKHPYALKVTGFGKINKATVNKHWPKLEKAGLARKDSDGLHVITEQGRRFYEWINSQAKKLTRP